MASSAKRAKFSLKSDEDINEIATLAANIEFPWDKVAPIYFTDWLEMFSKAHGTTKHLMFMSILPTTSALLGLSKLEATKTYKENLGLFTLCISPPSGGKNQCFAFGCKQPVAEVEKMAGKCLLLDKFTEVGLRQHLIQNDGVALIINEEMEDTLRQINSDREGGTLCRLFDGDSIYINSGATNARVAIERTSVSLGGFMQVRQFFNEIYPAMVSTQSGFDLRFLMAVMRPEALPRKETQPYAEALSNSNLSNLLDLYKAIHTDHQAGDVVYTLSEDALSMFDAYDEEICIKLNEKWKNGQFIDPSNAECGKERRLVLRLSVVLHVIYSYTRRQLFQSYGSVPRVVSQSCMKNAINLMGYFQQQRCEMNKVLSKPLLEADIPENIGHKILMFPGPVCTVSNFRGMLSSKLRKDWTPAHIKANMERLETKGVGEVVSLERTIAFVKCPPPGVSEEALQSLGMRTTQYEEAYSGVDLNLPTAKLRALISKSKYNQ